MQFVSVDVGTQSVRAALVTDKGRFLKTASRPLELWNPRPGFYQQSSDQIWNACCDAVKEVCREATDVSGIGFDATCSLVVLDDSGRPLTVSPKGEPEQNVVLWMDHRAVSQAEAINATGHFVLRFLGGTMSPEMQPPKLLWLKQHIPSTWGRIGLALDLSDFLTWRATGCASRSLCTAVCKWTYQAGTVTGSDMKPGWQDSFWTRIGLDDLTRDNYRIIGQEFRPPGSPCGNGLSMEAAIEMGLKKGTPVATSIIDGHAGGLGLLGCEAEGEFPKEFSQRLAIIAGTSAAHMLASEKCIFTPGAPGPFFSAMVPGMWLCEPGQSAAGALVDHVISTHPSYPQIVAKTKPDRRPEDTLNDLLQSMCERQGLDSPSKLAADLHVWPDFHGNRSPLADPTLRGMICGLTLSADEEDLARLYLATLQALAYGSRHIIDALTDTGHSLSGLLTCGGLAKNPLYVRSLADATAVTTEDDSEVYKLYDVESGCGNAAALLRQLDLDEQGEFVFSRAVAEPTKSCTRFLMCA
ncbi:LOW QUALITY PROTEIN: FGGY carbohydrate kinase domain-containing protein-like [Dermacentor silvarum]|uniref:LOW QUALITY PROTEIN: FGGY carbohydrate kinase domain-containing protein-like n=1 Tax=Dermacentor silvarum TaxID=543639 RepID=UPI0021009802|nr:LOW QUALITY PROTEIN: FGGY carbohydrate kinase domain-containing protein-like [Dermacentor silvarum]